MAREIRVGDIVVHTTSFKFAGRKFKVIDHGAGSYDDRVYTVVAHGWDPEELGYDAHRKFRWFSWRLKVPSSLFTVRKKDAQSR